MFRLKEQQLHMVMWMMAIASILLFFVFGLGKALQIEEQRAWKGMDDFSEGWIGTYQVTDESTVDVLTLPTTLAVKDNTDIVLSHKVPDVKNDNVYVTLKLDNASVRVLVENQIIYTSSPKEQMVPVRHIIPILPNYSDMMMTIEITDIAGEEVKIQGMQAGTYNQLWVSTLQTYGISLGVGCLLVVLGVIMLLVWAIMKNTWQQKRVLLYAGLEGMTLGALLIFDGEILPLLLGWSYGTYILKACTAILSIVLHLTIIRCFIYKKKVLGIVDTAILLVGVLYISVMVLQVFGLLHFDIIYNIASALYGVMVLLFTIVLAITIFDYQRREGMPIFVANVILILCMLCQVIMYLTGRKIVAENVYIGIGFFVYIMYIGIYGMRQAFYVQPKEEELPMDESKIRAEVIEQMNPNLLFASFQTLQSLIKSGSAKSVKMIYYISVYFRDNIKAMESAGEVVSFSEELEHMIAYLQLQKTRNQNLDFAMECKVKDFNIPRHSLVPLVENAVKHGIANHDNKGNVAVRTYTRADGYAIQIIDDGAGFDTAILRKKNTTIVKKLSLLEEACQARTEVISKEGKGTVVTIVLPILENDLMYDID